jgi:hypothetical protein
MHAAMSKSLLPPTGIMVSTAMLFDCSISPALRDTWLQLRALAWGSRETPEMSMSQLETLTGKKSRTLYLHLKEARERNLLTWRAGAKSTVIVSFPTDDELCKILQQPHVFNPHDSIDNNTIKDCRLQKNANDTCPQEWMKSLYELCGQGNGASTSPGMRKRISNTGKALLAGGSAIEDVAKFGSWWYANDWRGKRGQSPTPEQIGDSWHIFKNGNGHYAPPQAQHKTPGQILSERDALIAQGEREGITCHIRK